MMLLSTALFSELEVDWVHCFVSETNIKTRHLHLLYLKFTTNTIILHYMTYFDHFCFSQKYILSFQISMKNMLLM